MMSSKRNSALRELLRKGDVDQVRELILGDEDLRDHCSLGIKCLAEDGLDDEVRTLLEAGIQPNGAILKAAIGGYVSTARILMQAGDDINAQCVMIGRTPLMYASIKGHIDVVDFLLEHGAQIDITDHRGSTALMYACASDNIDVVDRLLAVGCKVNIEHEQTKRTALFEAVSAHNFGIIDRLVAHGADYNHRSANGTTILMNAVAVNSLELVEHLISLGCDVNAVSDKGLTPLQIATANNYKSIEELLLGYGAITPRQD